MTAKFSPDLDRTKNLCKTKLCRACGLYINQLPVFDKPKKSKIFWVGLSAVQFDEDSVKLPLSPSTNTGALIERIEFPFKKSVTFYKTNLVKCVPLKNDRIRYPVEHEMEKCFTNFEWELETLTPSIVFLLGKQVSTFVLKKLSIRNIVLDDRFEFQRYFINNINFVPVHHPSYMLVYKRKLIDQYIKGIQSLFPVAGNRCSQKRA